MRAGRMTIKAEIYAPVSTQSATGEAASAPTLQKTVWVEIKTPASREFVGGDSTQAEQIHVLRMRKTVIGFDSQIKIDGQMFDVVSINEVYPRRVLEVSVRRVVNA